MKAYPDTDLKIQGVIVIYRLTYLFSFNSMQTPPPSK